jgi:hypothetical protein
VGNLYEDDPNKKPKQKSMGIVLKRRDNAPIVKHVYGGIIDILMKGKSLTESVEFLLNSLKELVDGRVPLEQLIISKTLRGDYKDPTRIAHKVLADRIAERDPGNKPMVNDRIPFVYIKTADASALQGDRIEHPDFIHKNDLVPDYQFYITNQIMKPVLQLYALCITQVPGYSLVPSYWEQIDIELEGKAMYKDDKKRTKRIGDIKMKEVKALLFDSFIVKTPTKRKSPAKRGAGAALAAIEEMIKEDKSYNRMEIEAKEVKRGREYECTVVVKQCMKLNDAAEYLERVLSTEVRVCKGKKVDAMAFASKAALQKLADVSVPLLITSSDKAFVKAWKDALKTSSRDTIQQAKASLDMDMLKASTEQNLFNTLVHAKSILNYVIQ